VTQEYVDELQSLGINKIILLTHIGYNADLDLAAKVKGVDIIVGGHSHTLVSNLYAATAGEYPTVVTNTEDNPVLVVQVGEYGKYLGRLDVIFDQEGLLTKWSGDTILLSRYLTPDVQMEALIADLYEPYRGADRRGGREAAARLVGDRQVCAHGMYSWRRHHRCGARRNGSGCRPAQQRRHALSIEAGPVTYGDVLQVLPYNNLVSTFGLTGKDLLAALENGVSRWIPTRAPALPPGFRAALHL